MPPSKHHHALPANRNRDIVLVDRRAENSFWGRRMEESVCLKMGLKYAINYRCNGDLIGPGFVAVRKHYGGDNRQALLCPVGGLFTPQPAPTLSDHFRPAVETGESDVDLSWGHWPFVPRWQCLQFRLPLLRSKCVATTHSELIRNVFSRAAH